MKLNHILFTLGNILSFTFVSYGMHIGYTIGILAALLGIYIFRKDGWLALTQVFYLVINTINFIIFL
jgi:hypothetical protein